MSHAYISTQECVHAIWKSLWEPVRTQATLPTYLCIPLKNMSNVCFPMWLYMRRIFPPLVHMESLTRRSDTCTHVHIHVFVLKRGSSPHRKSKSYSNKKAPNKANETWLKSIVYHKTTGEKEKWKKAGKTKNHQPEHLWRERCGGKCLHVYLSWILFLIGVSHSTVCAFPVAVDVRPVQISSDYTKALLETIEQSLSADFHTGTHKIAIIVMYIFSVVLWWYRVSAFYSKFRISTIYVPLCACNVVYACIYADVYVCIYACVCAQSFMLCVFTIQMYRKYIHSEVTFAFQST